MYLSKWRSLQLQPHPFISLNELFNLEQQGASGRNFHNMVRDFVRIYNLDFVAILEPRVSGARADAIIKKIGLTEGARVEARGFAGGIWCLWRGFCPPISVISCSPYCIHLRVNPNSPISWTFSIVYASPHPIQREDVWRKLVDFSQNLQGPWCLAGDFNQALLACEKVGGAPLNASHSNAFLECINLCHLLDLGFQGQPFTWATGDLRERLDRALCNVSWQTMSLGKFVSLMNNKAYHT